MLFTKSDEFIKRIEINKLNFEFKHPPLLVGGMAMEYYGLRESRKDVDFIISKEDHKELAKKFFPTAEVLKTEHKNGFKDKPQFVDLFGDHGILIYDFEIWDNIMKFGYEDLRTGAEEVGEIIIANPEKLLILASVRGVYKSRYLEDAMLLAKFLSDSKYKGFKHIKNSYWIQLLERVNERKT